MTTETKIEYDFAAIEAKWQNYWTSQKLFEPDDSDPRPKYYALSMFPYPSGAAHVGHVRNYLLVDAVARYQAARGYAVINPIGWDAFGLPAENAAIRTGIHPRISTYRNIDTIRNQFKALGFAFDWSREVFTCREDYYKWTQWLFVKMLGMVGKSGQPLAYRRSSRVHWCPKDMTVLANEQVVGYDRDGKRYQGCFRCGTPVENRELEQWCFRITDYADELLDGLNQLEGNWPPSVLAQQREWIGRSEGTNIAFTAMVEGEEVSLPVFTTRADTLFGVTFVALAAEHPLVSRIVASSPKGEAVAAFVNRVLAMDAGDRAAAVTKQGIDTGILAKHPLTGEHVPVFVGDYVLAYGTAAVMGVPAHDQRDFEFAKRQGLPVRPVVTVAEGASDLLREAHAKLEAGEAAFTELGVLHDSGEFSGLDSQTAIARIAAKLSQQGAGGSTVNFRIRDWGISRQRYWGCPIPVVHCPDCGIVPVPEDQLPVVLPDDVAFTPTGRSPLEDHPDFLRCACPKCGRSDARRETDTMDTFVDSSWYYLRYCDPLNAQALVDREKADRWMPVDQYIGGSEHAILHLIYARFINRVMRDLGLTAADEPFTRLFTQGMIQREAIQVIDGGKYLSADEFAAEVAAGRLDESKVRREVRKMSKSQLNTVDPGYIGGKYGVDTLRATVMFLGPATSDAIWDDGPVAGIHKFIRRWWAEQQGWLPLIGAAAEGPTTGQARELRRLSHLLIEKAEKTFSTDFAINTLVAKAMELLNFIRTLEPTVAENPHGAFAVREALSVMAQCMAPVTPHVCDELWQQLGNSRSVVEAPWPTLIPELMEATEIEYPLQVNGKVRGRIKLPAEAPKDQVEAAALNHPDVIRHMDGRELVKLVIVPGRLVNVVVKN